MSRSSWFEFTTAILGLMRKRASPCWLQLCTRRAQFSQNLACPQGTKGKPSIGANKQTSNILHNTVMVYLQQLALLVPTLRPTRWQQSASTARRRRELSACWLGSSTFRTVSSLLYSPPSLTETTCLLLTYVLTLRVNAVDHIVAPSPSNNTRINLNAA